MKLTNLFWLLALSLFALLSGCGGGGGGGPVTYEITLRADRTNLPLNIAGEGPMIGGRYTTTLFVEAKDSLGNPIQGGEDVFFSCNIVAGLDAGALYYLDGDPEHETTEVIDDVEVTFPNAYRAVTLETNAGSASFHLHAANIVDTVVVRCTVTEAGSGIQRSAQVSIQIGGPPSGKVSQIVFDTISPNLLFVQGMNGETQVQIQANVVDEAGQVVNPATGANDMQVRIVPLLSSTADDDATLRGVNAAGQAVAGSSLHIRSINGKAQFALVSGNNPGGILIEAISDRSDNNVGNGIGEAVFNWASVTVVDVVPSTQPNDDTLAITTTSLGDATESIFYGDLLQASGGNAPYTWSVIGGGLPLGLSLSSNGVISGLPSGSTSGSFSFVVQVRDALGAIEQKTFSISFTAAVETPTPTAPSINGCNFSNATVGVPYAAALSASGGTPPYSWSGVGLPPGLSLTSTGIINGTPTTAGIYAFGVTVSGGLTSRPCIGSITINAPNSDILTIMTTALPNATAGSGYITQIIATGGSTPYAWSVDQLPTGLILDNATGEISGMPTVAGTFSIRVTVSGGGTVFKDLTLIIAADPTP